MSYESWAYIDEWGEPVVVLVVKGRHDVPRLLSLFEQGLCLTEHVQLGAQMRRQVEPIWKNPVASNAN